MVGAVGRTTRATNTSYYNVVLLFRRSSFNFRGGAIYSLTSERYKSHKVANPYSPTVTTIETHPDRSILIAKVVDLDQWIGQSIVIDLVLVLVLSEILSICSIAISFAGI